MHNPIDKKMLALILLTASAVVLTFIRERPIASREPVQGQGTGEERFSKEISAIVDSTFNRMGVEVKKIRHSKVSVGDVKGVREEVKIAAPKKFDVLHAISMLTDSLGRFGITLVSTENLKEKTSSIHLLRDKRVFQSIIISREQLKGAEPSVSRKQKGVRHKARQ